MWEGRFVEKEENIILERDKHIKWNGESRLSLLLCIYLIRFIDIIIADYLCNVYGLKVDYLVYLRIDFVEVIRYAQKTALNFYIKSGGLSLI